jgi:DNA-binding GntR family transcriptional regulator
MRPNRLFADEIADQRIPRVVLSDRVKEYIIEAVLNGDLKPGDRIIESSMARRLCAKPSAT